MEEQKKKTEGQEKETAEQTAEQINFLQLLKDLAKTQAQLAKINAQLVIKEGHDKINGVIDSTKAELEKQAKKFGANLEKAEKDYRNNNASKKGILEEYREALKDIKDSYENLMKDALDEKSKLEAAEQKIMAKQKQKQIEIKKARKEFAEKEKALKAEIHEATQKGDLKNAKQKIEELEQLKSNSKINLLETQNKMLQNKRENYRKLIEKVDEDYEKYIKDMKDEIDKANEDKNDKLSIIPKQNLFQKIMGSMFSKINGTKKFTQTVIGSLQSKITTLKEEKIPQIKKKIYQGREDFSNKIQNEKAKIEEVVQSMAMDCATKLVALEVKSKEKATNAKNAVVQGAKKVEDTAKQIAAGVAVTVASTVKSTVDKGKRTFKDVVGKGYELKMNFIQKAQDRLAEKQLEINKKMQILNPEKQSQSKGMEK